MAQDRTFWIVQDRALVGVIADAQAALPESLVGVWEKAEGDLDAFEAGLPEGYQLVPVTPEQAAEAFAQLGERRIYYVFANGKIEAVLDALFEQGEFVRLLNDEGTAGWSEALQGRWAEAEGDFNAFLQGIENELGRYATLEASPEETAAEIEAELEADRELIAKHWDRAVAASGRGLMLRALREYEIAVPYCLKYALSDLLAEIANEMGSVYLAMEDFEAACETLEEGLTYQPSDPTARVRLHTNASQAYELAGKRREALEHIEEALRGISDADIYDSLLAGVYSQAANLNNQAGDYERAISLYKLAVYLSDNSKTMADAEKALFHNNLGLAYLEHDDGENALVQLKRAVELQPDDTLYRDNLARAEERFGG